MNESATVGDTACTPLKLYRSSGSCTTQLDRKQQPCSISGLHDKAPKEDPYYAPAESNSYTYVHLKKKHLDHAAIIAVQFVITHRLIRS